jgi:hypothetical protein
MLGAFFVTCFVIVGARFAWLFGVTPKGDEARIRFDQDGTGGTIVAIKRTGVRMVRMNLSWMAAARRAPKRWMRIYDVTIDRTQGYRETYTVGVEARLFGYRELTHIDPRAGV